MNDIREALGRIAAGSGAKGVLVEIEATEGSAPRMAGARMLLEADGAFSGTVGGGGLEYLAQQQARSVWETGLPTRRTYSLGTAPGEATGVLCGGSAVLSFRVIGPEEAGALLRDTAPPPRVLLFGAGHVGKALADVLDLLGMEVAVADQRPELLTAERFPRARRILQPAEDAAVEAAAGDYVVIMTHSHARDYELALSALRSPAHYVGMIGSRKKGALFRERLQRDGIASEEIRRRLHSPIGLPIGAETPEEIAVSVAAEIIRDLRMS